MTAATLIGHSLGDLVLTVEHLGSIDFRLHIPHLMSYIARCPNVAFTGGTLHCDLGGTWTTQLLTFFGAWMLTFPPSRRVAHQSLSHARKGTIFW